MNKMLAILQDAVNRYYAINGNIPAGTISEFKATLDDTDKGGPYIDKLPQVENATELYWYNFNLYCRCKGYI